MSFLGLNQAQSMSMNEKLKNRKAVQTSLHRVVSELAISPEMIEYGVADFVFWGICTVIYTVIFLFSISLFYWDIVCYVQL